MLGWGGMGIGLVFWGIFKTKPQNHKQPRLEGACGGHLVQSLAQSRRNSEVRSKVDLPLSSLHPEADVLRSSLHLPFWPPSLVTWRQNLGQC